MNDCIDKNGRRYQIVTNYRDNSALRKSLNLLTEKTFSFNFEQWYQDGYWTDKYLPYSLVDGDKIVANISVNTMDFIVNGSVKHYIQLGTVMTDQAYRGQGLSRILMEKIFKDWEDQCDLIYLFANETVLDFYPKFGFVKADEYQYSKSVQRRNTKADIRKLDMSVNNDRNLLYKIVTGTKPFSNIVMTGNAPITMFHCTYLKRDSIYYIKDYETVAIADYDKNILYLQDVFCTKNEMLDKVIDALVTDCITEVKLGFVPEDSTSFQKKIFHGEDTLFIKPIKENFSENGMFPVLSHT